MEMQTDEITVDSHEDYFEVLQCVNQPQVSEAPSLCIRLNGCDALIKLAEAQQTYKSQQQWNELLEKKYEERLTSMSAIALNSIINVRVEEVELRLMIWDKIIDEYERSNEGDESQEDGDHQIHEKQSKQIRINIERMFTKLRIDKESVSSIQLSRQLIKIIVAYERKEQLLGNIKGIEYICYGIYNASPNKQFAYVLKVFCYMMQILNMKKIFYHGSPLYYQQLNTLCTELNNEIPQFYQYLQKLNVDWSKIFISYYRSLLLNKIDNCYVGSKIIDLVLVYGICIMRMIILRIVLERSQQFMAQDPQEMMNKLGTGLIYERFLSNEEELDKSNGVSQGKDNYNEIINQDHEEEKEIERGKVTSQQLGKQVKKQEQWKEECTENLSRQKQQPISPQKEVENKKQEIGEKEQKQEKSDVENNQQKEEEKQINEENLKKKQKQKLQQNQKIEKQSNKEIKQEFKEKNKEKNQGSPINYNKQKLHPPLTEQAVIKKFRKLIIGI